MGTVLVTEDGVGGVQEILYSADRQADLDPVFGRRVVEMVGGDAAIRQPVVDLAQSVFGRPD